MVRRLGPIVLAGAVIVTLGACSPREAPPEPEREFAARQLAAIGLTVEDFGSGWTLLPGEEGSGGGPGSSDEVPRENPCLWVTEWLPDYEDFATHSWRMYTAGDDATFASDWLAAAESGVDLEAVLAEFRETITACGVTEVDDEQGASIITMVPDIGPALGDASFSYRAEFAALDGTALGAGEVHTVVCGPLWLHLSYIGYDPFVERETLLPLLVDRASELGGC